MASKTKPKRGVRATKVVSQGLDPLNNSSFEPSTQLSKSAAILRARQEPKQTRASIQAMSASGNITRNPVGIPSALGSLTSVAATRRGATIPAVSLPIVAILNAYPDNPPSEQSQLPSQVAKPKGKEPAKTVTMADTNPGEKKEHLLAIGDRGTELWGYSDEEPMYDGESDSDLYLQPEPPAGVMDEEEEEADTDIYVELPTLDEPSIQAMCPAPAPRANTSMGARKGKKKRGESVELKTLEISDFQIRCWIKTGPARLNTPLMVTSGMTFVTFRTKIAQLLKVSASTLDLCYSFSFSRTKDYKTLTSESDWENLVSEAQSYRRKPTTKHHHNEDTWSVQLMEVMELLENMNNKGGSKKKGTVQVTRSGMPPPTVPSGVAGVSGGSGGTAGNGDHEQLIAAKLKYLNAALICTSHGGTYCLIPNATTGPVFLKYGLRLEHLRLSDTERRAWAEDMLKDEATKFQPSISTLSRICARAAGTQNISAALAQASTSQRLAPATPSRYEYSAQKTVTASYEVQQSALGSLSAISRATSLGDWLKSLDHSPSRQHQSLKYAEFFSRLEAEDILTLGDLIALGLEGLKAVGIKLGTASRILDWAKEDM